MLDTSILLGLLDPDDAHHRSATALCNRLRGRPTRVVVPASVLAELLVASSRLGEEHVQRTEDFVDAIADEIAVIDRPIARAAARLRARFPAIRLPDALVIATGQVHNADAVHTADKRWRSVDHRVRVLDA